MQNHILTKQNFVPEKIFFLRVEVSEISKQYSIFLKRTNMSEFSKNLKSKIRSKLWFRPKNAFLAIGKSILSTFGKMIFSSSYCPGIDSIPLKDHCPRIRDSEKKIEFFFGIKISPNRCKITFWRNNFFFLKNIFS